MNTFLRSVTFAPFVKPMPAFLHNFILKFFPQSAGLTMLLPAQICARGRDGRMIDWKA